MSHQPVANKKRDADKSRDELIDDLEHLRGLNTRLNKIVKRYEKAVGKDENDIFKTLLELDDQKERVESLRKELQEKQIEIERQGKELLVRDEEHLRMMIEASPVPMVVYEESRNYSVNKKFVETFGYTIEDIPSVNEWWPLAYPDEDYREYVKQIWYKAVDEAVENRTSIAPQEATVTCKDGTKKHVLCYFSSIGDLNLAIFYDMTERKRAEEALRESEEKFWVLVETTRAGIVLFRSDKFIYVNPMIEKALGYSKDELLAMNYWDIVHPDSQELVRSRGHARQQGLPVPSRYEIKVLTKGGETLWAEFSAAMIDYQGQPTVIATIFDITERKRAEEELKAAKAQAELYLDLMGHDINNMHQIALGYLELARDLHPEAGEGEFLDKPIEVLQRSARLIRNVRKLQKLQ